MNDKALVSNAPVTLWRIHGKEATKVSIRTVATADEWLDKAAPLIKADAEMAAAPDRAALKAHAKAIVDVVFAYDEGLDRAALEPLLTYEQAHAAFHMLAERTDPFAMAQRKNRADLERTLKGLPPALLSKAVAMTNVPASPASAPSPEPSED